ncbi:MAG: hypothetical protein J1F67_06640 [Muribaculaceae bacterium]|nr:hypothetical protein [Muribaculaceae bacterium]
MDRVFEDWKKALDDFRESVGKDLAEIRKAKAEVQALRDQLKEEFKTGKYYRDPNRLILSAPEIIIGNVDRSGELKGEGSVVVIRGTNISLEGSGEGGVISEKATMIEHKASDPGTDGKEDMVWPNSTIVNIARGIIVEAKDETDAFSENIKLPSKGGVLIHADSNLVLEAAVEAESLKDNLENSISNLEKEKKEIDKNVSSSKKEFETLVKNFEEVIESQEKIMGNEMSLRTDFKDFQDTGSSFREMTVQLYNQFCDYSKNISRLAEISRKLDILKKRKEKVPDKDTYKKKSNGAKVYIRGENISLDSMDGEGNLRNDAASGLTVRSNSITLGAVDKEGSLQENGRIQLKAKGIDISGLDEKDVKRDGNLKRTGGKYDSIGKVNINAKEISLGAVDYEFKDSGLSEKSLTKSGKLILRFENMEMSANSTDGKATGEISMNAKDIKIKSSDIDTEKGKDKGISSGSSLVMLSEKLFLGAQDKENQSNLIQVAAETVGFFAKTTYEVQQGEKKGVLQMDGGKVEISGEKTALYGETSVNGKTTLKGEIKGPKAEFDSVNAKSQFKSPNISDGMAAGSASGGDSLKAKLDLEELTKKE